MVTAPRKDGQVPFRHAEELAERLPAAHLVQSVDSHLLWFSPDFPFIADRIRTFFAGA